MNKMVDIMITFLLALGTRGKVECVLEKKGVMHAKRKKRTRYF